MAAVNRVYAARLAGMVVLGPDGESIGRVRDVVISISIVRQQPRVLGLVVELLTRRRIFVPILRVTAIEPGAVTLATGNVSLRRFSQRPGEVLVLGQVVETRVRVDDPDLPQLTGIDVIVVDLGIEQTRTRDWVVTKVAVRPQRRLGRRSNVHVVDWQHVHGLTPSGLAMPDQGVAQLLEQFEGQRAVEVADAIRELPDKRRYEVVNALDDERLADVLQELPEDEQADLLRQLEAERAADVLEAMDPDDAADLLGTMAPADAEQFLRRMDPEDSEDVRRLLKPLPRHRRRADDLRAGGAGPRHHSRRGAGAGPRPGPDPCAGLTGVRRRDRPPPRRPAAIWAACTCSACCASRPRRWSAASSTPICRTWRRRTRWRR